MQDFSAAKGIDDVESTLTTLKYSFRQTVTNQDGTSLLIYEKVNENNNAYDLAVFFKKKSNVGFSAIRYMTYYEKQFQRLKTECSTLNTLKALPEETANGCLERKYTSAQYEFQFKSCNNQNNGLTHYQIEVIPLR